jgi:hypothetical protein
MNSEKQLLDEKKSFVSSIPEVEGNHLRALMEFFEKS